MKKIPIKKPAFEGVQLGRLMKNVKALFDSLRIWKEGISQRKQLFNLNDRMLKDIGINRTELVADFRNKAWEYNF